MYDSLQNLVQSGPVGAFAGAAVCFLLYLVLALAPLVGVLYVLYFLLTLPMRRNERARLFLELLEMGLKDGQTAEAVVLGAASSQDRSLGVRFHLLAAHLEQGMRFGEALEKVPRLVPPRIRGMLRAGERLGDLTKVLPACRESLKEGVSHVRGAINYLILLAFVVTPFAAVVPIILRIKVLPKFVEIFDQMLEGQQLPAFTRFVLAESGLFVAIQIGATLIIWLLALGYLGGPRLQEGIRRVWPGLADWFLYRLPWRRKRLQRDFSAILALLLDANVPEAEAVGVAGEATGNVAMMSRVSRLRAQLKSGVKLTEAVASLDDSGEFRWRLASALHRGSGFVRALAGWHEALEAKAFQLEQSAAQIATTLLVLINGVVVACIVIGIFLCLIQLINRASLW